MGLGLTTHPFPFRLPDTPAPAPLATMLGDGWSVAACARIEQQLGTTTALCMPMSGPSGTQGALRLLLGDVAQADLIAGVIAHASAAAAGQRLAGRAVAGCLLRDVGLDAWHLTAVVDDAGRPLDLM